MFTKILAEEINQNMFELIGREWMLISAGTPEKFNTMTASWGGIGVLFQKHIAWCVIRPVRYTYEFVEENDCFSLSFFGSEHKKSLSYCGSVSGRDEDKIAGSGLTPAFEEGVPYFEEAKMVLICRKLYFQDMIPENVPGAVQEQWYPNEDFHRFYFAEIEKVLVRH